MFLDCSMHKYTQMWERKSPFNDTFALKWKSFDVIRLLRWTLSALFLCFEFFFGKKINAWWSQVRLYGNQIQNMYAYTHTHTQNTKTKEWKKQSKNYLMVWNGKESHIKFPNEKWFYRNLAPAYYFMEEKKDCLYVCASSSSSSSTIESIWLYSHSQWPNAHT